MRVVSLPLSLQFGKEWRSEEKWAWQYCHSNFPLLPYLTNQGEGGFTPALISVHFYFHISPQPKPSVLQFDYHYLRNWAGLLFIMVSTLWTSSTAAETNKGNKN